MRCLNQALHRALRGPLSLLIYLLCVPCAGASDGTLEINQACVLVGCFSGDSPGFPVTISQTGSYKLTSSLGTSSNPSGGIEILSNAGVDLDLNGFAIGGPGTCSVTGSNVSCSGLVNNQFGILASASARIHGGRITGVYNGVVFLDPNTHVRLFDLEIYDSNTSVLQIAAAASLKIERVEIERSGGSCIFLSSPLTVDIREARVLHCNDSGIVTTFDSPLHLSDSVVAHAGVVGVIAGDSSTIERVTVRDGEGGAIQCGRGCLIRESLVTGNGGAGVQVGFLSQVIENQVDLNGGTAISASDGSTVSHNTVGATSSAPTQSPGIACNLGCGVFDNVVRSSSQPLTIGSGSRYGKNVFSVYPGNAATGFGVSAGDNLCNGVGC